MGGLKVEILERRRNPLLSREEVRARLIFDGGTPSRVEVREALARVLGRDVGVVFVRRILTEYGKTEARVLAMVYDRREEALKIEPEHIIRRNEPPPTESGEG
ncbi:MAG: 30S ribosomal protein S24e [Thermoproteota archaeon]|nr:MAG: 30S ribosomal protein S24e [Candidatus Korarchaeota archaeon]